MKIFMLFLLSVVAVPTIEVELIPDPWAPAIINLYMDQPTAVDPQVLVCRVLEERGLMPPIGFEVFRKGGRIPIISGTVQDCRMRL